MPGWSVIDVGDRLGGGFDGHLLAEGFELADQAALAGFGVGVPGEVLGAMVRVVAVVGQQVPVGFQNSALSADQR